MIKMSTSGTFLAAFTALALAGSANAAIITYSGYDDGVSARPIPNSDAAAASFDAAASLLGTEGIIDFESAPLGAFTNLTVAPGVTINGTDYLGSPQTITNSPSCASVLCGFNTTVSGSQFLDVNAGTVTFTFATPTSFFGAYIGGVQYTAETILFNDGSSETVTIPGGPDGGMGFIGFTDEGELISSITISTPNPDNTLGDFISVDDVRYETGAAVSGVPEPGTLVSAGFALAGLALFGRKRRRA